MHVLFTHASAERGDGYGVMTPAHMGGLASGAADQPTGGAESAGR